MNIRYLEMAFWLVTAPWRKTVRLSRIDRRFASRLDQTRGIRHPAGVLRFIIHFTRGLIREQRARRSVMFFAMIGTLVWLFLGATFLDAPLRERPFLFVLYWLACAWVTLLVVLLALFDLLMVRAAARREQRRLAQEILKKQNSRDEDAR
ncbi:MAG TPA: hypothetical protein VFD27_19920 [Chthoniobacteraceae bacterium]|jgi:hypothetical protein|nr:hypothetical protein [Chthoniobacteraceae bacterium]